MFVRTLTFIAFCLLVGCDDANPRAAVAPVHTERATFAAGCFWGVEATFAKLDGVVATTVGFSGGHVERPTYKDLCSGKSGHAETVQVEFDPARISYAELLDAFWSCHDPTELHITGPESGEPQRSIIFVNNDAQRQTALASRDEVNASAVFKRPITTEIIPAETFYPAEEYHQQYLAKHGANTTCHTGETELHTRLAKEARARR